MKDVRQLLLKGKEMLLRRDRLLLGLLGGILLLVIIWPIPASNTEKETEESFLWDSKSDAIEQIEQEQAVNPGNGDVAYRLEKRLEELLSSMDGVGEVRVMITLASTAEKVIEKDRPISRSNVEEEDSAGGVRNSQDMDSEESTVYLTGDNGEKIPYVVMERSPGVEGVSVVAQGGNNALVQKNIIQVIQALFAIDIHKIKLVKMK